MADDRNERGSIGVEAEDDWAARISRQSAPLPDAAAPGRSRHHAFFTWHWPDSEDRVGPGAAGYIPVDVQTSFEGNAGAVKDTQNQMPWLILLALLAVYIVLGILYELRAPADHPLDPAFGRVGALACADPLPQRAEPDRADRPSSC